MTVTTTAFTTPGNSKQITIANEIGNGSTNIIAAVDSAITSLGWTAWDTVNAGVYNPIVTKVYRVLNADAVTYKYFIIRWDTVKLMFYTSTCEYWYNNYQHQAINESWSNGGAFAQGYDLVNSFIIVAGTARHLILWNNINNQAGLWTGVFEFERVATEDRVFTPNIAVYNSNVSQSFGNLYTNATSNASVYTSGIVTNTSVPCFAWTNSVMLGTPWGVANSAVGSSNMMFAPPRTADGNVGVAAIATLSTVTNRGPFPPIPSYGTLTYTTDPNYLHLGTYANIATAGVTAGNLVYAWDTTKSPVSTVGVDASVTNSGCLYKSMPFGRIYSVGIGRGLGNVNVPDTTYANVDSTNGWVSSTGSNINVIPLPLNGGIENNTSYSPSTFSNVFANIGSSMIPAKAVAVGNNLFVAANAGVGGAGQGGIFTISQASGQGATPTFRSNISFGVFDILFDGNGWIWGSTSNGIVRMDTQTFTTTFYTSAATIANGVGYLGIDNHNIYCTSRVASTKPQTYVFDRIQNTFNGTIDTTTAFTSVSTWGTPVPDYAGNVYSFQTPGVATATSLYMQLNSNTATYATVNSTTNPGAGAINYGHTPYYDPITQRLWELVPSATAGAINVAELFPGNLATRGTVVGLNTQNTTAATYQGTLTPTATVDNRGDLYVFPSRGHLSIGTKRPGAVTQATTGAYCYADPISWNANNANPGNFGNINTGAGISSVLQYPQGFSGWTTTNTVQMFAPWGTGTAPVNDNRLYTINGLFTANTTLGGNIGRLLLRGQ